MISGHSDAVDRAIKLAEAAGAQMAVRLPMSVPAHSPLMQPASDSLAEALNDVEMNPPSVPVIHNVDVKEHHKADEIRHILVDQVVSPVRWVETIEHLKGVGVDTVIECGPGNVLTGLFKRTDASIKTIPIGTLAGFNDLSNQMAA